ncbi:YceI family protein [Pareuzebyella sediminis]|uniref:YceI family protein n=1 Tax=Pareuzebyella sediminis TaxID=2607998 RepID=UPI0011EF67D6|nr:YceI family protein [Pareuzebyella sediminis]
MKKIALFLFIVGMAFTGISQETYTLSDESAVTIDGTSTIHDWTVTANTISGSLKAEGELPKEILFEVEVDGIKSERGAAMDKKMHEALKKEEHPKVTFTLTEAKDSKLVGALTIAGKEQTVEVPSKIEVVDGAIKITGEKSIILQDYDVEPPTAMFGQIIVGDEVTVKFDLVFSKS